MITIKHHTVLPCAATGMDIEDETFLALFHIKPSYMRLLDGILESVLRLRICARRRMITEQSSLFGLSSHLQMLDLFFFTFWRGRESLRLLDFPRRVGDDSEEEICTGNENLRIFLGWMNRLRS